MSKRKLDISFEDLKLIYTLISKKRYNLDQLRDEFLPDVSKYQGKVLVEMDINLYYAHTFSDYMLLTPIELKVLDFLSFCIVSLGQLEGKHSCSELSWRQLRGETFTDPYEIHQELLRGNKGWVEDRLKDGAGSEEKPSMDQIRAFIKNKPAAERKEYAEAFKMYMPKVQTSVFDEAAED